MTLVHRRGMSLSVPNNSGFLNPTLPASNSSSLSSTLNPLQRSKPSQKSSWFSRLLDYIPGFKWLKTKICRQIYGPTYGLSDVELREYKIAQIREERIENKRREREAEFKVAKFMAFNHPKFYWHKYIDSFDKGTEERKRGVLLFILTSKESYGHYYGRGWFYKGRIDAELAEMGIRLDHNIALKEDTEGEEADGIVESRLKVRDLKLETESDDQIFEKLKKTVEEMDISHLNERQLNERQESRNRKVRRRRREFQVWEEQDTIRPHF